ncbi:unnamed protein product [Rhodiola kirilowii]
MYNPPLDSPPPPSARHPATPPPTTNPSKPPTTNHRPDEPNQSALHCQNTNTPPASKQLHIPELRSPNDPKPTMEGEEKTSGGSGEKKQQGKGRGGRRRERNCYEKGVGRTWPSKGRRSGGGKRVKRSWAKFGFILFETRFKILDRSVCYSIRVCVRRSRNEKSARFAGDEVFISVRRRDTQMTDKRKTGKKKKKKGKRNGCVMSGEQACALRAVQEWVFLGNGGDSVGGSLEVDGEFNVVKCGGGGRLGEKMVFELHCHSICSDGFLSPTRVVERAYENGVKVLALTDHDTMSGIPEALVAARKLGIKIIPGVEISTMFSPRDNSEAEEPVHILAYYSSCGPTRPEELEEFLASIRDGRYVRAQNMISKLNSLKMPVKWEHVARIAGKGVAPGRVHVARAMLEAGHVENLKQAFSRYLHDNGPAYSKGSEPLAEDTVRMIRNTGGVAVLAHPWALKNPASVIRKLKEVGLHGMEVYRCDGKLAAYSDLADACELLKLGGSDFHGKGKNSESSLGSVNMPVTVLHDFLKVARPIWRDGIMNTLEGYIVEPSEAKLQEITRFRRTKIMDPFSCKKELINSCVSSWLTKEEMQNPELEAIMLNLNNALITLESHQVAIETPPPG